ncbi:MAG TPA: 2Fe-2S iron-sulfur cluster-binding protein [Blastocatellia bacterium]|nr:2Fe-2S iron-sulfur cluster-binding protein [Blastocatellia bacterium]
MTEHQTLFEAWLNQHDDAAWAQVIFRLLPSVHEVDRRAVQIWFAFFPLKLKRAFDRAADPARLERDLVLKGKWRLADQVDSSAHFLYGHRWWPQVKKAVAAYAESSSAPHSLSLEDQILEVAGKVAGEVKADRLLLTAITAVAFMTLQQVGHELFRQPSAPLSAKPDRSPEQILRERATDDSQGILAFLRTVDKRFTVTFDENDPAAKFPAINLQDLTMAAKLDARPHHLKDARCVAGEGPIPVECRTAACGTCWVGVLSDASKVSAPTRLETDKMNSVFCYPGFNAAPDSPIRLACQTRAHGNVSIVIPPWNGLLWRLKKIEETEAETVDSRK